MGLCLSLKKLGCVPVFLLFILISAEAKEVKITCSGMTVKVSDGIWTAGSRKIPVKGVEFRIDPPTIVSVESEVVAIGDERPNQWAAGTRLKGVIAKRIYHGLPGCLVPDSVVVKSRDGTVYEEGIDYIVDHTWGAMGRISDGKIEKGEKVLVDYKYSLQRIDLIQCDARGNLSIKKGKEEKTCPVPPVPDEGNYALANIFLPYNTTELTEDMIFPVLSAEVPEDLLSGKAPPYPGPAEEELEKIKFVHNTLEKLRKGDTVTIVFWGNSVTAGGDASSPAKAFPQVFVKMLREKFPDATIKLKNAGIGGSNTNQRLPNLQKEVLRFNPQLVVIEFVNDMGMERDNLRNNYFSAIDQIREAGAEVIILTPHFVMPSWMGISSVKHAVETRPAVQWLREIAEEKQVGLADVSKRWERLAQEGIPYTTLLWNGINHPDDRGHKIFAEELIKFFPGK